MLFIVRKRSVVFLLSLFVTMLMAPAMGAPQPAAYQYSLAAPTTEAAADDWFGESVAIHGTRVVVGASNLINGSKVGAVYVYELASATPLVPILVLKNPVTEGNTWFGAAVALAENHVIVSAQREEGNVSRGGRVYVYDLTGSTPDSPKYILENPTPSQWDDFGYAVAVSGTTLAVSSPGDSRISVNVGSVYLYDLTRPNPALPFASIDNPEPEQSDRFGTTLAISPERLVVGTPYDNAGAFKAGTVYVYPLGARVPGLTFYNPTPVQHDHFGASVAISGDRLVIGDAMDDIPKSGRGTARVYDLASATPTVPVTTLADPDPSQTGFANPLAIDGEQVAVSAIQFAFQSGTAHLYDLSGETPSKAVRSFRNPAPSSAAFFGSSVALHQGILAAGIPRADGEHVNQGAVAIFAPLARVPEVANVEVVQDGARSVNFRAMVNPNWGDTTCRFSYRLSKYQTHGAFGALQSLEFPIEGTVTSEIIRGPKAIPVTVRADLMMPGFTYELLLTVENAAGSFTAQTYLFSIPRDESAPSVAPPTDGFVPTRLIVDESGFVTLPDYRAQAVVSDDIGVASITQNPAAGSLLAPGAHVITITAADAAGNTGSTSFTLRVRANLSFPQATVLFSKGDVVPGAGDLGGEIPAGAVWNLLGRPTINDDGAMAFSGQWRSPEAKGSGIYVWHPALDVFISIAASGQLLSESNLTLVSFKDPLLADDGSLLFLANAKSKAAFGSTETVLCWSPGVGQTVKIVARTGATILGNVALETIRGIGLTSGGHVALRGTLAHDAQTTIWNDSILLRWSNSTGELVQVLREGTLLPGYGRVKSWVTLRSDPTTPGADRGWLSTDANGQGRLHARVTFESGRVRAMTFQNSVTTPVLEALRNGGGSPMDPFESHLRGFGFPSFSEGYSIAASFHGLLSSGSEGIFDLDATSGQSRAVLLTNEAAPGVEGATITGFTDPLLSVDGKSRAWYSTLRGGGLRTTDRVLYRATGLEVPQVIAREGAAAAGCEPDTQWKSFVSLALPGGDTGPLFTARLTGPDVTSSNHLGLWAVDSKGGVQLLLRTGQFVGSEQVRAFHVLGVTGEAIGSGRSYNDAAQVAVLVTTADRSMHILRIDVP